MKEKFTEKLRLNQMNKITEIFRSDVKIKILFELKNRNNYLSSISKKTSITYAYVVIVSKFLMRDGLIKLCPLQKYKRKKFLMLTDKGHEIVNILFKLMKILK